MIQSLTKEQSFFFLQSWQTSVRGGLVVQHGDPVTTWVCTENNGCMWRASSAVYKDHSLSSNVSHGLLPQFGNFAYKTDKMPTKSNTEVDKPEYCSTSISLTQCNLKLTDSFYNFNFANHNWGFKMKQRDWNECLTGVKSLLFKDSIKEEGINVCGDLIFSIFTEGVRLTNIFISIIFNT